MFEDAGERYHGRSVLRKPYWSAMRFRECDGRRRLLARLERAAVVWNRRLSRPRFRRGLSAIRTIGGGNDSRCRQKIGRAHVRTQVTHAHLVCPLPLEKK